MNTKASDGATPTAPSMDWAANLGLRPSEVEALRNVGIITYEQLRKISFRERMSLADQPGISRSSLVRINTVALGRSLKEGGS